MNTLPGENYDVPPRVFLCSICGRSFESRRQLFGHKTGKHLRRIGLKNAIVRTKTLSESQKGYLAAFLDGEGGIQLTRSQRPDREYVLALHPTVYFTNTDCTAIQLLRSWLGCGCVTRRREEPPHNDVYALSVTGTRNVLELLKTLRPYLIIKRRQADVLIEYCESRLTHYRAGDRRFNSLELQLYSKLRRLNKKGGRNQRQPTAV